MLKSQTRDPKSSSMENSFWVQEASTAFHFKINGPKNAKLARDSSKISRTQQRGRWRISSKSFQVFVIAAISFCRKKKQLISITLVNLSPHIIVEHSLDPTCSRHGDNQHNQKRQDTTQKYDCENDGSDATASVTVAATSWLLGTPASLLWSRHRGWLVAGSNDRGPCCNRNIGCSRGIRTCFWRRGGHIRCCFSWKWFHILNFNRCGLGKGNLRASQASRTVHHYLVLRGCWCYGFFAASHAGFRCLSLSCVDRIRKLMAYLVRDEAVLARGSEFGVLRSLVTVFGIVVDTHNSLWSRSARACYDLPYVLTTTGTVFHFTQGKGASAKKHRGTTKTIFPKFYRRSIWS